MMALVRKRLITAIQKKNPRNSHLLRIQIKTSRRKKAKMPGVTRHFGFLGFN